MSKTSWEYLLIGLKSRTILWIFHRAYRGRHPGQASGSEREPGSSNHGGHNADRQGLLAPRRRLSSGRASRGPVCGDDRIRKQKPPAVSRWGSLSIKSLLRDQG